MPREVSSGSMPMVKDIAVNMCCLGFVEKDGGGVEELFLYLKETFVQFPALWYYDLVDPKYCQNDSCLVSLLAVVMCYSSLGQSSETLDIPLEGPFGVRVSLISALKISADS